MQHNVIYAEEENWISLSPALSYKTLFISNDSPLKKQE